jgi:arsenical pump membrane protein
MVSIAHVGVWLVAALCVAATLIRPYRIAEWIWALGAAAILVVSRAISIPAAVSAVGRGLDVYLFLAGMIVLAELARRAGLFEFLAARAVDAGGSSNLRLFALLFGVGVLITALLSNDATAIVLTPAVYAAVRRTDAEPLPYLYACAFVANAASFLLPIGNPANLVVFDGHVPGLREWLSAFAAPSIAAVAATGIALALVMRRSLSGHFVARGGHVELSRAGLAASGALGLSAVALVAAAAFGSGIGIVAAICAAVSLAVVSAFDRGAAGFVVRHASWSIVPLVAGLFVVVAALDATGALALARNLFHHAALLPPVTGNWFAGATIAIACNVLNNLPVALAASFALSSATPPIAHAALVAIDLGPNLSVTGSLATLLWLLQLRRDGVDVTPTQFAAVGAAVTIPALLLSLALVR